MSCKSTNFHTMSSLKLCTITFLKMAVTMYAYANSGKDTPQLNSFNSFQTDPGGRPVQGVGPQAFDCWNFGFESR